MANEKMVKYYEFDKETELYKLVSELGENQIHQIKKIEERLFNLFDQVIH